MALESFDALIARFTEANGEPYDLDEISLAEALRTGRDPLDVLLYLGTLGRTVGTLDQLLAAINGDDEEEDLFAFRVVEGVAVAVASSGAWLLFLP